MENINHVAIIMDGNGRWAKRQNRERTFGHLQGVDNLRNIAMKADELGIKVLTVYAFSTENWTRPLEEVSYIMKLPELFFDRFMKEIQDKNICIRMIGEWDRVPEDTHSILQRAIDETKTNTGMILNFAFNYGGRREIILAARKFAQDYKENKTDLNITEEEFEKYLQCDFAPKVDLMIRTSGEYRISNFLLYELAYAEMMFVKEAWPEFTPEIFEKCVSDFYNRDRRYGGIKE